MFTPTPDMAKRLNEASVDAKKLLTDLLMDAILKSDSPEDSKIEVRIMQAYGELDELLMNTARSFACPVPMKEEELRKQIYPARQNLLEYLQLMKSGLENFLVSTPVPDIPPEYRKRAENPFDHF